MSYLVLLDEADKGGALNLHGVAIFVKERNDKVEEVALAQVGRRLLLKVRPAEADTATTKTLANPSQIIKTPSLHLLGRLLEHRPLHPRVGRGDGGGGVRNGGAHHRRMVMVVDVVAVQPVPTEQRLTVQ